MVLVIFFYSTVFLIYYQWKFMKNLKFYLSALIIFSSFLAVKAQQNQPFRFQVSFEEIANLTYQLDCLNDFTYCQKDDYRKLWETDFLKTDDDRKMLAAWKEIRARYSKEFEISSGKQFPIIKPINYINSADKIQIAGFQAKNIEDYLTRLDLLVLPKEREQFEKIIRHFKPNFAVWWEKEAKQKGQTFAAKTDELLNSAKIKDNIARFYNFYQPSLPENYLVTFDMFYRPNLVKSGSSGRALENHLLVEFLEGEHPAQRIDVVLHEFCHFLLGSLSDEDYFQLQNKFLQTNRPAAVPAFNLMNESLASALGNGIIARLFTPEDEWQKYLAAKGSFYNNPNIDQAAKAILPIMDDWLAKGGKINDENFVKLYLDTLEKSFGESLLTPQLFLNQTYLFVDKDFDDSVRYDFRRTLKVQSLYAEQEDLKTAQIKDYFANPNLSSAFIIFPNNLKLLADKKVISDQDFKQIGKRLKKGKHLLYAIKRNENAYNFVIIAETEETAKKLVGDLAKAPKLFLGEIPK